MRVICIDILYSRYRDPLTLNKIYDTLREVHDHFTKETFYYILNDNGKYDYYDSVLFKLLDSFREEQIDKILE